MKKLSYALAALCCSSALYAQNFSGLEITPTIGWVVPEGNLDLKSKANYGIRIGQMYEYVGTELGYEFAKAKFKNSSSSFNVHRGFLNLLLPFSLGDSKFDLYGLIGAGYENFGKNLYGNKNGGFGHYGLGLKYKISDYFGLRAEVRDELAFNRANHHLISTLGFVFNFDTNKKSVLPVQEEVKQEVKEEVKQEVKEEVVPSVEEIKQACYDLPTEYVYFAVNKANVEPKYNENLKYLVSKANEQEYNISVYGYADPSGNAKYNEKLSKRRADAVKNILVQAGFDANKIKSIASGETNTKDKKDYAKSRRVEVKVLCD